MNEWNDNQWREFFGDHSLELRTDKWFTRRVLNRLPRKRWSIEAKISFVVSVLVIAICTVLCLIFAKEMIYNPCWTCAHTWLAYMGLSVGCVSDSWVPFYAGFMMLLKTEINLKQLLSNEREAWVERDLCLSPYLLDSGVWREINSAKESL